MNSSDLISFIVSPLLIFFSFFLNFLSSLFSEVDLFKVDLTKKRNKKTIFVLRNNQLFFAIICFVQVPLNLFISFLIFEGIEEEFFEKLRVGKGVVVLVVGIFLALVTEIFSRYLATRNKKLVLNNFFVNVSYVFVRPFYFLRKIVRPKRKIFNNSEQDIIRFIKNLAAERILEKQEALLIQSAFQFDEKESKSVLTLWKKVIFFTEDMTYEEIKKKHLKYSFTRYPVLNKRKKIIGVFNIKKFYQVLIKEKDPVWRNSIDKKVIYVFAQMKLDKILAKMRSTNCHLLFVKDVKKSPMGIITFEDVVGTLFGKVEEEEKRKLLPSCLN